VQATLQLSGHLPGRSDGRYTTSQTSSNSIKMMCGHVGLQETAKQFDRHLNMPYAFFAFLIV